MITIPQALKEIVAGDSTFRFGLHNRILNLTQFARFIRPLVEARTGRSATPGAIVMALSRLQAELREASNESDGAFIDRMTVHSNLCSLTLQKSTDSISSLNRLFSRIRKSGGYVTVTEGLVEVTAIFSNANFETATSALKTKPLRVHRRLAGLGILIKRDCIQSPGILYRLLQQLALQRISIIEVASTMSEFNIYLDERDLMLAMDSIYNQFLSNRPT